MRTLCWVSAGAASAVAAMMTLRENPDALLVYCETGAEDEDNARFLGDFERRAGREVIRLRSDEYPDTWAVWEDRRFLAGIAGAPCTSELKIAPRLAFQQPDDVHVFGYTCDAADQARAKRFRLNWSDLDIRTPLIDAGIDKRACLAMVESWGIRPPRVYAMGFQNANCIPCVKATSPDYWSLVRLRFPAQFQRMAKLSRELGARLTRINDERIFIDEIPADWPVTNPIQPSCDFLCALASMGLAGEDE